VASQKADKVSKKKQLNMAGITKYSGKTIKKGNFIINSAINLYSSLNGRQITDKEIARDLGITPSTLSKYKNGEIELGLKLIKRPF
jgi:transcriptional regulator with XRE-family HTH domain